MVALLLEYELFICINCFILDFVCLFVYFFVMKLRENVNTYEQLCVRVCVRVHDDEGITSRCARLVYVYNTSSPDG